MKALLIVCGLATAASAAPSPWIQEIVDYDQYPDTGIALVATAEGPAIFASPGSIPTSELLVRGPEGWRGTQLGGNGGRAIALANGEPWYVMYEGRDSTLVLRHGNTASEVIAKDVLEDDRVALAIDAAGVPHVCIAGEQANRNNKPAGLTLRYATRGKRGWIIEPIKAQGHGCTIAVGDGGIAVGTNDGVALRANGTWQVTSLGGHTRVASSLGKIVAVTAKGTSLLVTREGKTSVLADKLGTWRHAIVIDAQGRVHVAVEAKTNSVSSIHYVVEGTPGAQLVAAADAEVGIAIAIDAGGQPVIAYGSQQQQTLNQTLRYARKRTAADTRDVVEDVGPMVGGCGDLVSDELANVTRENARANRLCAAMKTRPAAELELATRCKTDARACLVKLVLAGGKRAREHFETFEITFQKCGKGQRCNSTYHDRAQVGQLLQPSSKSDGPEGQDDLRAACALGNKAACTQAALVEKPDDVDALVAQCTADAPLACALALRDKRAAKLPAVRTALETSCKTAPSALACNALAFVEEEAGRSAQKLHVRACNLGSAMSCAKIVGKVPAPKGLDADRLVDLLGPRCERHDGSACVALSEAFARGWVVKRDKARAKEILETACGERIEEACTKLGRKLPPE